MDCLFDKPGFWSLAGVVVGLLGGEGIRLLREYLGIKKAKKIILGELRAIKSFIPFKMDILDKSINAIKKKGVLATASPHSPDTGYRFYISKLYKQLSLKQRNCLHVIYERLRFNDEFMDDYEEKIRGDIIDFPDRLEYNCQIHETKLREIRKGYLIVDELIDSYLAGNPKDVFYTDAGIHSQAEHPKPPKMGI